MAEDRRLTLIVVPHGDLETRTFEVSYGRLKFFLLMGISLLAVVAVVLALWFPIAAQAGRVPGLVMELERLEGERAQVAELARTLAEVEAQYERVRQLLGADAPSGSGEPVLPPLRSAPDSAGSGDDAAAVEGVLDRWPLAARGFVTRRAAQGSGHPGVDVAIRRGTLIHAAGSGIVRIAGIDDVYGHYVVLEHGRGVQTLYGHADTLLVAAGEKVASGQSIARVGTTGRSSAPHLHFEVRRNGRALDPLRYVSP